MSDTVFLGGFADELEKIAKATYPISRAVSKSWLIAPFRHSDIAAVTGRLASGKPTGRDTKLIAKIIQAKRNTSSEKAMGFARKVTEKSKAGGFSHLPKKRLDRFIASSFTDIGTGTGGGAYFGADALGGLGGALYGGAVGSGFGLGWAAQRGLGRLAAKRGLIGRIRKGSDLLPSEKELINTIDPGIRAQILGKIKQGTSAAKKMQMKLKKK